MKNYKERIHDAYSQNFAVDQLIYQNTTDHFDLQIFANQKFGRVMALDGIIQTTEADEFIYHEMLTHVPLFALPQAQHVLIVGGGDGGMLREVLKHKNVRQVTQVEIDMQVVELCKKHLPKHSQNSYDDPRLNLIIDDALNYLKNCQQKFDLIISDATDPVGPGKALFSAEFYKHCQRCLQQDGILVTQNGVAFFQMEEAISTYQHLKTLFPFASFYSAAVPTYVGGIMLFGFASNQTAFKQPDLNTLQQRHQQSAIDSRYYDPAIHLASFALPRYVQQALQTATYEQPAEA